MFFYVTAAHSPMLMKALFEFRKNLRLYPLCPVCLFLLYSIFLRINNTKASTPIPMESHIISECQKPIVSLPNDYRDVR